MRGKKDPKRTSLGMKLQDKTAVVTGGGTGIGLGIAAALAAQGCRVAITGRRENKLREAVESCGGDPPMLYRAADVADRDSVGDLFRWADAELGRVDILVHSAGMMTVLPSRTACKAGSASGLALTNHCVDIIGSTTLSANSEATVASMAFPPASSISEPAAEPSG